MADRPNLYRFSSMLMLTFSVLSVPIIALVLAVAYVKNSRSMQDIIEYSTSSARSTTVHTLTDFFDQALGTVRGLAGVAAAHPQYFLTDESASVLHSGLVAVDHLDALAVMLESGVTVGATRIDAQRRAHQPEIPAEANWQRYSIEPRGNAGRLLRRQVFFQEWPKKFSSLEGPVDYDPRLLPSYIGAKRTRRPFIAPPSLNPATGGTVISIAAPILVNDTFEGAVVAHFTITEIAHFLSSINITPNSMAVLVDADGEVIAAPFDRALSSEPERELERRGKITAIRAHVAQALEAQRASLSPQRPATATINNQLSTISIFGIELSPGLDWQLVAITPFDDFVGPLRQTNVIILWLLAAIIPIELLLIYRLSRRLSSGIEHISRELNDIRTMDFYRDSQGGEPARVREIAELKEGVGLLYNALRSFAQYIPVGVVRQLVESGQPLTLGVERRTLSILFSDLENFSTYTQDSDPEELLLHLSQFFASATSAISEENGTVDKFIGDAVMAFWGAPTPIPDHPLRACAAALRIARRLEALSASWVASGKSPLRVRIGLHMSEVLVGNIGSPERLSYTVLGDGVNVASRLEGVNKQFGTTICMSDTLYSQVSQQVVARPLGPVTVKGRTGEFMVYELLGLKRTSDPELAVVP